MLNQLNSKKKAKQDEQAGLSLQITVLRGLQAEQSAGDGKPRKRAKLGKQDEPAE